MKYWKKTKLDYSRASLRDKISNKCPLCTRISPPQRPLGRIVRPSGSGEYGDIAIECMYCEIIYSEEFADA